MSVPVELFTRFGTVRHGDIYDVTHTKRGTFRIRVLDTAADGARNSNPYIRSMIIAGEAAPIGHRNSARGPGEEITLAIRNITRLYPADVSDQAGIDSRDATAVRNGVQHSTAGGLAPPEQRAAGVCVDR